AAAAPLAGELTRRLTRSRLAGLAAGALVGLDAGFAFAGAAGLEATLLAALGLAALLAFAAGRPAVCGALLALAILTRLEALALALLLGLAAAASLTRHWPAARPTRGWRPDLAGSTGRRRSGRRSRSRSRLRPPCCGWV